MGARETALNVLIACRREDGWSNALLKEHLKRDRLDKRDAALATRVCYGVLQNRYRLDFYLQQLLTGSVKTLHPALRDILHIGLYQMYEMDRVPASAAVNESVQLAKKYCPKLGYAAGLVNAVLRNAERQRDTLVQPSAWQEKYSHPQELIDRLKSYVGKERIEALLRADNAIPDTVVQVNTLRTTPQELGERLHQQGVEVRPHAWMDACLVLSAMGDPERLEAFREGLFYVQDAAAKLSVLCAQIPENARVLDACAAPGGKSFAAAVSMGGHGRIVACDVYEHKISLIAAGAKRLGLECIEAKKQDATEFVPAWEGYFDTVLCDVPCSGYGIIRKKPDIRYKDLSQAALLPALQKKILDTQSRYVRAGGVLLYSTCTLSREENESVVENFLKEHPDFALEALPLPPSLPANDTGMLALVTGQYDTDGFFIARLRRKLCT